MRLCGIDPGAKGALCVLDSTDLTYVEFLDIHKYSIYEMARWLHHQQISQAVIEDVHSIFGMSAKSNFGFGRNLGIVTAILQIITKGEEATKVTPKVWQKAVGVTAKGKDIKVQVAKLAQQLYPKANIYGKRGGLIDGRSDALMIAHYGLHIK